MTATSVLELLMKCGAFDGMWSLRNVNLFSRLFMGVAKIEFQSEKTNMFSLQVFVQKTELLSRCSSSW